MIGGTQYFETRSDQSAISITYGPPFSPLPQPGSPLSITTQLSSSLTRIRPIIACATRPIVSMASPLTQDIVTSDSSDDEDLTQSVFTRAIKPVVKSEIASPSAFDGYESPDTQVVDMTTMKVAETTLTTATSPAKAMSKVVAARERLLRLQKETRGQSLCEKKATGQYNKDLHLLRTYVSQKAAADDINMEAGNMSRRIKKWNQHEGPWTTEEFDDIYPYRLPDGTKVIYRQIPVEHLTSASVSPPQPTPAPPKKLKKKRKKKAKQPKSDDEAFEAPATKEVDKEVDDGEFTPRALSNRPTRPPISHIPGTPDEFATKKRRRLASKGMLYYEPTAQSENTCHGHRKRLKDHLTLVHVECKCKTISDNWKGRAHCLHCLIEYQVKGELDCLRCFHCRAPIRCMHTNLTDDQCNEYLE